MLRRQQQILEMLRHGRVDMKQLSEQFGVSEMTVRRDFRALESKGELVQVKGGAIAPPLRFEGAKGPLKINENQSRIAKALFEEIMPCKSIFISSGSTTFSFAKLLAETFTGELTVITNSLTSAAMLFRSTCRVILLGGELRSSSLDLIGPTAERNLSGYRVDWLVSGCDSASGTEGFFTSDLNMSNLEKASLAIAAKVAIITESKKFRARNMICFAGTDDVDLLVTDRNLPIFDEKLLTKRGVRVVKAGDSAKTTTPAKPR